jgi:hypothetical protein
MAAVIAAAATPANIALALELLIDLATQGAALLQQIKNAQSAGVDITPAQLDAAVTSYQAIHAQLDKDIAAAKGS